MSVARPMETIRIKTIPCTRKKSPPRIAFKEDAADPGVGEDDLDEDGAGNQLPEHECQGRRLWQQRVADGSSEGRWFCP